MATYLTASKQLLGNYACISTLEPTDIQVGDSVVVGALGAPFNGTFTVLKCPQYKYTGVDSETGEWTFDATIAIPNNCLTIGVNDCCGAVPMPSNDANTFSSEPRERHNAALYIKVPSVTSPLGDVLRLSL